MDPTQFDPEDDRAATDPSAAEQYEGAPAASDAPDDDAAPQEETEGQIDWQAVAAEREHRAAAAEQRAQQLEAEQQRLAFQASQYAWQREEEEHHQRTANLDYEQKVNADRAFYASREQRLMNWAQTATQAVWVNQHADDVIRRYGLSPDDRIRLGPDPAQMEANAEWIVNERSRGSAEVAALRKELTQLKRQVGANRALDNPAYRQGGARPGTSAPPTVDPTDLSQWTRALEPWLPQRR
jgi:hypothetical protein